MFKYVQFQTYAEVESNYSSLSFNKYQLITRCISFIYTLPFPHTTLFGRTFQTVYHFIYKYFYVYL